MNKKEIDSSIDFLKTIINYDHKTYCHPYGGRISYNEDTFRVLNEKGVRYAFSVENRDITYTKICILTSMLYLVMIAQNSRLELHTSNLDFH